MVGSSVSALDNTRVAFYFSTCHIYSTFLVIQMIASDFFSAINTLAIETTSNLYTYKAIFLLFLATDVLRLILSVSGYAVKAIFR